MLIISRSTSFLQILTFNIIFKKIAAFKYQHWSSLPVTASTTTTLCPLPCLACSTSFTLMYALPHVFGVFPGSLQPSLRMSIFMEGPNIQTKRHTNSLNFYFKYKLKGWIALKATSDWLLKLRKSFVIHTRATRRGFLSQKFKQLIERNRKKMVVSKVNYEFNFFGIRGKARGIIDGKREKMIRFHWTNTKYSSINR